MGFFGFMRAGEFTTGPGEPPALTPQDVAVDDRAHPTHTSGAVTVPSWCRFLFGVHRRRPLSSRCFASIYGCTPHKSGTVICVRGRDTTHEREAG